MSRSGSDSEKLQSFWLQMFSDGKSQGTQERNEKSQARTSALPADAYLQFRLQRRKANAPNQVKNITGELQVRQSVEPQVAGEPDLGPSPQSSEPISLVRRVDEMCWLADEDSSSQQRPVIVEWDAADERFSWLAAPNLQVLS